MHADSIRNYRLTWREMGQSFHAYTDARFSAISPSPVAIKLMREANLLTQSEAARVVGSKLRTWQQWEAGSRKMHPGLWELFNIKIRETGK